MHLRGLCSTHSCWSQDAAASKRGVESYLCEAESWKCRRCFKTHALPHLLLVLGREESGDTELRWTKPLSIATKHTRKMSQDVTRTWGPNHSKVFPGALDTYDCKRHGVLSECHPRFPCRYPFPPHSGDGPNRCACCLNMWLLLKMREPNNCHENMGKIWETHCNDPVDLDGFRRFPWICRQTSWIQLAYLEICQSFPEIKSLPRSWHVINLFARRCVGIPPKILVLVADPRHAFTVWWQTLGQQPGFMAGRLAVGHWLKATTGWIFRQGSSQTSPSISTSSHSSVKLRRRQDSRSDQLVLNRVALPIVLQYSILI